MSYRKWIFFLLLLIPLGCSTTKVQQKKGAVKPVPFYSKIPFDTYKSVIGLQVQIGGVPKTMLFDTGADLCVIQRDVAVGKTSKYTGASKRKMELGQEEVPSIRIGNAEFVDIYALNGDMAGLKEQIPNFGGLIGQSIIQKANWLIDYPNRQLEVSDRELADDSFQAIEIVRKNGNNPYTFIEVNGRRYQVVIDLGSSSAINLPDDSAFAREVAGMISLSDNTRERYTLGGLQTITEQVGVLPKVKIGEFELEQVDVNINTSSQPRIGIRFFKDFLIYIDNANKGVYKLKKSPAAGRSKGNG